ncbi:hypothetical protein HXX76_013639 [Chlamydomonas incerta]|uniref:Uncharacterized protein n=1 Tax=Chlamydomonas incerta TaxID=51695 RepID=A0A835SHE7_CHLIN|nr:hypothetical protein HXX76_013639 [Chlamydomonas incerta]|eukprot:KAG2425596.1 hypothetical protein HXX76_013639 [Chlamydomonas incerta]
MLDVSFRRTAREKIQASLDEHFQALHDLGLRALQLNLDLNSFNERKIKLPDVAALATWPELTRLTLQESGWRSQQLRVDAGSVFGVLQYLQELTVVCKYSGTVKARWLRPPSHAEQLVARMPKWPPGAGPGGGMAAAAAPPLSGWPGFSSAGVQLQAGVAAVGGLNGQGDAASGDAAMEDVASGGGGQLAAGGLQAQPAPPTQQQLLRPVVTQHLRCQMTQNQSMASELQKAMRRMTPALQAHVSALTFEIVEETYAEPARGATPLDVSALPGLKSLTVLSGAEDALANSKLDVVGATALESLVLFDVSCGCWCYNKPGHGIPPRLLSSPAPCLRSLTVVGFVVHQCTNLHALSLLTCLEELRLEQPDPDSVAAVTGEVLLTWLPPSLRVLKLHSVVLPPCGLDSAAAAKSPGSGAAGQSGLAATGGSSSEFGGGGGGGGPLGGTVPAPFALPGSRGASSRSRSRAAAAAGLLPGSSPMPHPLAGGGGGGGDGGPHSSLSAGAVAELQYGVAPTAPLPHLRELYLSKCKVPALGVLGVCPQLTSLGVLNCLSCSGALPVAAALPGLRQLAIIHTLSTEQELGPSAGGGPVGSGLPGMASMFPGGGVAGDGRGPAGPAASAAAGPGGALLGKAGGLPAALGGGGMEGNGAGPASAGAGAAGHGSPAVHVPGLPLPPVVWGSDEQVAAIAACSGVSQLELILPRGSAGSAAVGSLAAMPRLRQLDVSLPCGLSEGMMGLARLGRGGRLQRLTLWVDSRTCVNRNRSRQLQAIQRSLQAHMPDTLVEWAGAESRHSSWTGLEARVFSPH